MEMRQAFENEGFATGRTPLLISVAGPADPAKFALIQGPVSRFGDTAANAGIIALLESNSYMKKLPMHLQTAFAY